MRLSGITAESIVDGPGLRFVLFTQGCAHACECCHNPNSWAMDGGNEVTVREIIRTIRKQNKNLKGITFSGGEPFLQGGELAQVADAAHARGWNVVTYTGFTYESLLADSRREIQALLAASDILVDGAYMHALRKKGLRYRGSTNQRVIDLAATRKAGKVALLCE